LRRESPEHKILNYSASDHRRIFVRHVTANSTRYVSSRHDTIGRDVSCLSSQVEFGLYFTFYSPLVMAGSIPAAALSSATLDKLFTHICLWHQAA